jgi:hypothetical protein
MVAACQRTALIDRNPKERSGIRIARDGIMEDGDRRRGYRGSRCSAAARVLEVRAPQSFENRVTCRSGCRTNAGDRRQRATDWPQRAVRMRSSGSAPSIDTRKTEDLYDERNSSDWTEQRAQRQKQGDAARESQRVQRESWQRERALRRQRQTPYSVPERQGSLTSNAQHRSAFDAGACPRQ